MTQNPEHDEETWDEGYFGLINELIEKNSPRYESQTERLLSQKNLACEIQNVVVKFKLTPLGCQSYIGNPDSTYIKGSWVHMGLGKSAKRKALPLFFATAEADVLINPNE